MPTMFYSYTSCLDFVRKNLFGIEEMLQENADVIIESSTFSGMDSLSWLALWSFSIAADDIKNQLDTEGYY